MVVDPSTVCRLGQHNYRRTDAEIEAEKHWIAEETKRQANEFEDMKARWAAKAKVGEQTLCFELCNVSNFALSILGWAFVGLCEATVGPTMWETVDLAPLRSMSCDLS